MNDRIDTNDKPLIFKDLTYKIIGAALEVYKILGFGFIENGNDDDLFFHSSSVEGGSFDDLQEGQRRAEGVVGPAGPTRPVRGRSASDHVRRSLGGWTSVALPRCLMG